MVPHFMTALSGAFQTLEKDILNNSCAIERWFRLQWLEHTPPFYGSVDLRNSGFKIAPVDTNLFPGGFNNLSDEMLPLAIQASLSAIEKICPEAKSLLLIPERHTRNTYYLQNVARLVEILTQTGLTVRLGSLAEEITEPTKLDLANGDTLTLEPLIRDGQRLKLAGFDPCAILLNNDLSAGVPSILQGLNEQILLPPLHAGWTTRRKTAHFSAYSQAANHFAESFSLDPWLIDAYFDGCRGLNFQQTGEQIELADKVDAILQKIRLKYQEYKIDAEPFVIVKADAGTYGMGIMTVKDASEVKTLNRKQRNKMAIIKEGLEVSDVIIQEGVHTIEQVENGNAEPVVYMIDRFVVGGFYRINDVRGIDENLNAPGMYFQPLAFDHSCNQPNPKKDPCADVNRFYSYGVIARLALLGASIELEQTAL